MGTSPIPVPKGAPLGGTACPDTQWAGGRYLVLQGPQSFLGARWLMPASVSGQPAVSPGPPLPPEPIPGVVEGSIPFVEVEGAVQVITPPADTPEGSTVFIEEQ
jgi:hypothetical protein